MSDIPGGPGWWQASDGRLDPPELHPSRGHLVGLRSSGRPIWQRRSPLAGSKWVSVPEPPESVGDRVSLALGRSPHHHLLVLSIAAVAVLVIAWFVALATGELPSSIRRWLTSYLRYYARLSGYILLLTDRYPPFRLTGSQYPIDIETPRPVYPVSRCSLVSSWPSLRPLSAICSALDSCDDLLRLGHRSFEGRLPRVLFEALASVIRFQVRVTGYMLLLVRAYPHGIFGARPPAGLASLDGEVVPTVPWEHHREVEGSYSLAVPRT